MEECKGGDPPSPTPPVPQGMAVSAAASTDIPAFELCAALVGHTDDVRSLAVGTRYLYSGSRDKKVMAWELNKDGSIEGTEREPAASILLPDWVNALTVRKGTKEKIVAGCTDGVIYVMAWDGGEEGAGKFAVEKTLLGHVAPISSLSWTSESLLLSGSWDETARGWNLETCACEWVLSGHENNVCVLGLDPGAIATGSTGIEVDGHIEQEQIRMWTGTPPKESMSLTDHTSGIRDLCLAQALDADTAAVRDQQTVKFCSASNDGTVRAWTADGTCRAVFVVPGESFVFSVKFLGDSICASGDDAGNLTAFRLPPASEPDTPPSRQDASLLYKHPKTVWSVAPLPGTKAVIPGAKDTPGIADVATGSADNVVRIFTANSQRALRGDRLEEAEDAAGKRGDGCSPVRGSSRRKGGSKSGGAGDTLPFMSEMGVMVGEDDGQLSAFADDATNRAEVFRWTKAAVEGGKGRWEPMGTLRPPARKVLFEGKLYDKVIPVEVESASRGFLMFQLGVNRGDVPESVAATFCDKHGLGPEYLPQINQFLLMMIAAS